MIAPVVAATESLRRQGHDVETVASLLLNGAAALCLERYSEEEFGALARQLWRTAARQVQLLSLLDRVTAKKDLGVRPKRSGSGVRGPGSGVRDMGTGLGGPGSRVQGPGSEVRGPRSVCPVPRTLRQGETS